MIRLDLHETFEELPGGKGESERRNSQFQSTGFAWKRACHSRCQGDNLDIPNAQSNVKPSSHLSLAFAEDHPDSLSPRNPVAGPRSCSNSANLHPPSNDFKGITRCLTKRTRRSSAHQVRPSLMLTQRRDPGGHVSFQGTVGEEGNASIRNHTEDGHRESPIEWHKVVDDWYPSAEHR